MPLSVDYLKEELYKNYLYFVCYICGFIKTSLTLRIKYTIQYRRKGVKNKVNYYFSFPIFFKITRRILLRFYGAIQNSYDVTKIIETKSIPEKIYGNSGMVFFAEINQAPSPDSLLQDIRRVATPKLVPRNCFRYLQTRGKEDWF